MEASMQFNTKLLRTSRNIILLFTILVSLALSPTAARALGDGTTLPDFWQFARSVQNNQAGVLRGVYVPNVLAFPVVQQPSGNVGYVSLNDGEITQFGMPAQ